MCVTALSGSRVLGYRGLFDGISGTWLRQMTYSVCRFWAYDQSKKILGAGPNSPPWKLAAAGVMGAPPSSILWQTADDCSQRALSPESSGIQAVRAHRARPRSCAEHAPEIIMVRMQGDMAKPPEKRLNYKHALDALYRVSRVFGTTS